MEMLIRAGFIKGVLDLTTTEWCDELVGGVLNAGPHRSEAASQCRIPQVVSVGALDMVNFGPFDTVPEKFAGRNLYKHNPMVTLMRTTKEENAKIGEKLAEKLNMATEKNRADAPVKRGIRHRYARRGILRAFRGPGAVQHPKEQSEHRCSENRRNGL